MGSVKSVMVALFGCLIGVAGLVQGWHWRSVGGGGELASMQEQLELVVNENELLRREVEELQKRAGLGRVAVPKELLERLEKEYGYRFAEEVDVMRVSEAELRDRVEASMESRFGPGGVEDRQEAYRLLGWIGKDEEWLTQWVAIKVVGSKTWMDDETGEMWVTENYDSESIPDQCAMYRMLVKRVIWERVGGMEQGYRGDDEERAREAKLQGCALSAESRLASVMARTSGVVSLRESGEAKQLMLSVSPFVRELALFSAKYGKGAADAAFVQGREAFDEYVKKPCRSTQGVMGGDDGEFADLAMQGVEDDVFFSERAGRLGLELWLRSEGDGLAEEVAKGWKNDRYVLVADGEEQLALVWEVQMQGGDCGEKLWQIGKARVKRMLGKTEVSEVGEQPIQAEDGSWYCWLRLGQDRVRMIHSASKATMEELVRKVIK